MKMNWYKLSRFIFWPKIDVNKAINQIEALKKALKSQEEDAAATPKFRNFLEYLDAEFADVQQKKTLLTENKITYELLWFLFPIGCEVVFTEPQSGRCRAGEVHLTSIFRL